LNLSATVVALVEVEHQDLGMNQVVPAHLTLGLIQVLTQAVEMTE
jgi:hypothetical protein